MDPTRQSGRKGSSIRSCDEQDVFPAYVKKLPRDFYDRSALQVAVDLLGCHIISQTNGARTGGMIVETEAYVGSDDPASHAFIGRTERNEVMFGPPGMLYVYFTYGNHFMLNVVAGKEGYPAAILLRGMEPLFGLQEMAARRGVQNAEDIASGPGKLAKALAVGRSQNGADLTGREIYLKGPSIGRKTILASPRIGIGDRGSERLWRFFLNDNPHVSRPAGHVRKHIYSLAVARKMSFCLSIDE